jgi:hypothetical protein
MKEETIDVVVVRPGEAPTLEKIPNTLEAYQAAVGGGYVQAVGLHLGVNLWCDEDGMAKDLPPNRFVEQLQQFIFGTFFLTGAVDDEGETTSIPEDLVALVVETFALKAGGS